MRPWLVSFALLLAGCYRTPMLPPPCDLEATPAVLDFGQLVPGDSRTLAVAVVNHGDGQCLLSNIALDAKSAAGFSVDSASRAQVASDAPLTIAVTFQPESASIPLNRKGTLTFDVESVQLHHVAVPLAGSVVSDCRLQFLPSAVDFGHVPLDTATTRSVRATNKGTTSCEIQGIAIGPGSDPQFSVIPTAELVVLVPGQETSVDVAFAARDRSNPHHRTGSLAFATNDASQMEVAIPLSADIDVGCDLNWNPASLDFGTVTLNKTTSAEVSLGNGGSTTCQVSGIAIAPGSAASFSLADTQASLAVPVGSTARIGVTFFADSALPHKKTGSLVFQTGNAHDPSAQIPLSGQVNTPCADASRWIYTFDTNNSLARFDPTTLTFTDIASLNCSRGDPFSMAVDQNAVAWVHYGDGSLFKVDTATGNCQSTTFQPNQHGIKVFGMGFVFDPSTGEDRLFIAGGQDSRASQSELATVSFPDLVVTPIASIDLGSPELSGTGDGQLWGFAPQDASSKGVATLMRINPASGAIIESYDYPSLTTTGAWSVKFWGGDFWIFLGPSVFKVERNNPKIIKTAIAATGRAQIVGAGVSTCAPL